MCSTEASLPAYPDLLNDQRGWDATVGDDSNPVFGLFKLQPAGVLHAWSDNAALYDGAYLRVHTGFGS